jgi:hypothetical protein
VRALVAGWFSFAAGHATAGDLLARDLVCEWLASAGCAYDIAAAPPFEGDVDLGAADPAAYSHAIFVCGPFEPKAMEAEFLGRFARCRVIGVNLTMTTPPAAWNPFDVLIERDSAAAARPDLVFRSPPGLLPVVGRCLVEAYEGAQVQEANAAIARLVGSRPLAVVDIDTRLDRNATGLRSAAEIESLLARMDVVVTTRLHGMVMALRHGVPAIAIDPEPGGAKIARQAATIGWPVIFTIDRVTPEALRDALADCLTGDARARAAACAARAATGVEHTRDAFLAALAAPGRPEHVERKRRERIRFAAQFARGERR